MMVALKFRYWLHIRQLFTLVLNVLVDAVFFFCAMLPACRTYFLAKLVDREGYVHSVNGEADASCGFSANVCDA